MRTLSLPTSLLLSLLLHIIVLLCSILFLLVYPPTITQESPVPAEPEAELLMLEDDEPSLELIPREGKIVLEPELHQTVEASPIPLDTAAGENRDSTDDTVAREKPAAPEPIALEATTPEALSLQAPPEEITKPQEAARPAPRKKSIFEMTKQFVQTTVAEQTALSVERLRKHQLQQHVEQITQYSYKDRLLLHATHAWQRFQCKNEGRYTHLHPPHPVSFDFSINQDGSIRTFTVLSSSGSPEFDELVRTFLYQEAAPFPPIPLHLGTAEYHPQLGCTFYLQR